MGTKLYVGNLSYQTTENDLRSHFEEVGTVQSCDLILDKFTSKSRGFAFVEMGTADEAEAAIRELNGKEFDGRALVINEARPREERGPREGGGGGYGGHRGGGGGGGGGKGSRRGVRNEKRGGYGGW